MKEKKKKTHGVQLILRTVVTDPDGKVITDTGEKAANSFVRQFLEFWSCVLANAYATSKETDGTQDVIWSATWLWNITFLANAGINVDNYGIQVGTGDTAPANTNYKLETPLTEGVGAGNITHNAMTIGTAAVVGANVDLVLKRSFTNGTGDTITVKEAGLVVLTDYGTEPEFLIIRDVLSPTVDVPDKCSITVIYTLRTTV